MRSPPGRQDFAGAALLARAGLDALTWGAIAIAIGSIRPGVALRFVPLPFRTPNASRRI